MDPSSGPPSPPTLFVKQLLGGAFAGLVGRVVCHPIDTIKTRLQAAGGPGGLKSILQQTARQEGLVGFYRGLSAVLVGGVPATCLYLACYEQAKRSLTNICSSSSLSIVYFLSGMVAETVSCILFVPIDVVKERLQVQINRSSFQELPSYKGGFFTTLRQIHSLEGILMKVLIG